MAMPAVRCLGWMLSKVWRLLFDGLHVDHDSILGVKKLISSCDPNTRIVFAPTHKTHLDYLIVSYLCFAYGISLPRIAAGNNLDLPLVGSFLRANGSIFIRRSFKDDDLYKKVLKNYVHELMEDGNPIEVFIEAGRSRHGRVCKPRLGFLSMFLDYATSSGDSKDVLIVPISLDYDKVLEVNDYSNQLLGKKKKKESLWGLLCSVSKLFFLRCGHAYVRFGEPISVKNSFSIEKTAHLVSCQLQKCGTVTSTCIIASILMWKRIGLTLAMIEARAKWLLSVLRIKRTSVAPMNENVLALHALDILNVKIVDGNIRFDIASPSRALELSFYRNHLLREFLPDMAVIGALQAHIVPTGESSFNVNNMLNTAEFIWKYLTHVCQHNNVYLREELLRISESTNGLYNDKNLILIHSDDWRTNKYISFTSSLLWPFIESLWLASLSLWLLENEGCSERELISKMQCLGRNLLSKNLLYYPEALCQETLKQSLEYLAQLHFVSRYHETNSKNTYMLYPGENYCTENKLPNLTSKINNIRKPKSFLWKQPEAPCNICGDEVLSLMKKDFVLNRK
jgi:glycerol-3-phosphate O-acyltransferase